MIRHALVLFALLAACGGTDDSNDGGPLGGALTVSGDVIDFQSRMPVGGTVSISTSGITPPPMIATSGASYTITQVPESSVFQILAGAAPTHRSTYSPIVEVTTSDRADVDVPAVSSAYVDALAAAFQITPTAARGILFARLVDGTGAPKAGVPATNLAFAAGADTRGPFFLDADLMPAPNATASSASGWVVLFEVAPGVVSAARAANATVTLDMPTSPVTAGAITIADVTVTDGAGPVLPSNVSFRTSVLPIFTRRGCVGCHSGEGPGRNLGNLKLDAGPNPTYDELKANPLRVQLAEPEKSLILTKPLYENPPNHQNATFATPQDPDYLAILVWIREGAKNH